MFWRGGRCCKSCGRPAAEVLGSHERRPRTPAGRIVGSLPDGEVEDRVVSLGDNVLRHTMVPHLPKEASCDILGHAPATAEHFEQCISAVEVGDGHTALVAIVGITIVRVNDPAVRGPGRSVHTCARDEDIFSIHEGSPFSLILV